MSEKLKDKKVTLEFPDEDICWEGQFHFSNGLLEAIFCDPLTKDEITILLTPQQKQAVHDYLEKNQPLVLRSSHREAELPHRLKKG